MPEILGKGVSRRTVLAAGLATLAGCGTSRQAGSGGGTEVVFLGSGVNAPFTIQMAEGFKYGVSLVAGVTARVTAPSSIDAVQQMKIFQQEVTAGTRSISLTMPFGEQSDDPIEAAARNGIQLVAVDPPPLPGSPVKLYVGNDNESLGRLLADTVADRLGAAATGKIVVC